MTFYACYCPRFNVIVYLPAKAINDFKHLILLGQL